LKDAEQINSTLTEEVEGLQKQLEQERKDSRTAGSLKKQVDSLREEVCVPFSIEFH
jgi:hypothetical protein